MGPKKTEGQLLQHVNVASLLYKHWNRAAWIEDILPPFVFWARNLFV